MQDGFRQEANHIQAEGIYSLGSYSIRNRAGAGEGGCRKRHISPVKTNCLKLMEPRKCFCLCYQNASTPVLEYPPSTYPLHTSTERQAALAVTGLNCAKNEMFFFAVMFPKKA